MFCFTPTFSPTQIKADRSTRLRFIGSTHDDCSLIMVNTTSHTSIQLVTRNGENKTAISFHKYCDLVNADLSYDKELMHITERIPSPKGFAFISSVYHIFSSRKSIEFKSELPIQGYFLPECKNGSYQMIHVVGPRLTHLKISIGSKSVEIEKIKGGIHIRNTITYSINRMNDISKLSVIYIDDKSQKLSHFAFDSQGVTSKPPITISVHEHSSLPFELSLDPRAEKHFNFFSFGSKRIFIGNFNQVFCVIQQLFFDIKHDMSFQVSLYPKLFNETITISGVAPDFPLCFYSINSLIFVFVPNHFMCMIDLNDNPPTIITLPQFFSQTICSPISSSIPIHDSLIDLHHFSIFSLSFDFSGMTNYLPCFYDACWKPLALIAVRIGQSTILSQIIHLLEYKLDVCSISNFIHEMYRLISLFEKKIPIPVKHDLTRSHSAVNPNNRKADPHSLPVQQKLLPREILQDMDIEFPSASGLTRIHSFRQIVNSIRRDCKTPEEAADKALSKLTDQNSFSLMVRKALDLWIGSYSPSKLAILTISLAMHNEAIFYNQPAVPCLKEEIYSLSEEMCSTSIRRMFNTTGFYSLSMASNKIKDSQCDYWRKKFGCSSLLDSFKETTPSSSVIRRKNASSDASDSISPFGHEIEIEVQ